MSEYNNNSGGFFEEESELKSSPLEVNMDENMPDRPLEEIEVVNTSNIAEYSDEECDMVFQDPADEMCLDSFRNNIQIQGRLYFKGHMKIYDNPNFTTRRAHYNILVKRKTKNGIRKHLIYARSFGDEIVEKLSKLKLGAWIRATGNIEAYKGQNYIKVVMVEEISKEQLKAMYKDADYFGKKYDKERPKPTTSDLSQKTKIAEAIGAKPRHKEEHSQKSLTQDSPFIQSVSPKKESYFGIGEMVVEENVDPIPKEDIEEIRDLVDMISGEKILDEYNEFHLRNGESEFISEPEEYKRTNDYDEDEDEDDVRSNYDIEPHTRRRMEYDEKYEPDPDSWGAPEPSEAAAAEEITPPPQPEPEQSEPEEERQSSPPVVRRVLRSPAGTTTAGRRIIKKEKQAEPKFKSRFG